MILNISNYKESGAQIFTDRDMGVKARRELELDEKELQGGIVIRVPKDTWGINPSFFGGLFETSIKRLREDFWKVYNFEYTNGEKINESLEKDINDNYEYVLSCLE